MENALLAWIKIQLSKGARLSGDIIKNKARSLAAELGVEEFSASCGWFTRFKERHQIIFRCEQGEKAAADVPAFETWQRDELPNLLQEFRPRDIFNADETGIYYRYVFKVLHV